MIKKMNNGQMIKVEGSLTIYKDSYFNVPISIITYNDYLKEGGKISEIAFWKCLLHPFTDLDTYVENKLKNLKEDNLLVVGYHHGKMRLRYIYKNSKFEPVCTNIDTNHDDPFLD